MYLNKNFFSGTIPAAAAVAPGWKSKTLAGLVDTSVMSQLSLASNRLTGTIPAGLWQLRTQACISF